MAAKINKDAVKRLSAKAFYTLLKEGLDDNSIYAGVSYIPDSDWQDYTLGYFDSEGYNDSESIFYGGVDSDFDFKDESFYNQTMYSMHKIYPGGISRVIPRSDWTYGKIYNSYPKENNYVLVKEYVSGFVKLNVYQCVFSPRTSSLVNPTGTSQDPISLSDGYHWKYMYTITQSEAVRFITENWMPVSEKIKRSEFDSITPSSNNYEQYISQINAEAAAVYSVILDSDVLKPLLDSELYPDPDNHGLRNWRSNLSTNYLDVIGRDVSTNTPKKDLKVRLRYDQGLNRFTQELLQNGSGYIGPITFSYFGIDSDVKINGLEAFLAPGAGHGSDAPQELEAGNITISSRNIADEENDFMFKGNKYNLLTLHVDPVDSSTGQTATADFYITCPFVTLEGVNQFIVGDILRSIQDDGRRAEVVAVKGSNVYYIPTKADQPRTIFAVGETICLPNELKKSKITASNGRGISSDSSQLLIAERKENIVTREEGQIESFNFVLSF